jgi:hypothetical protein
LTLSLAMGLGWQLKRQGDTPAAGAVVTPAPVYRCELEMTAGGMDLPKIRVPKDHEIHLLVRGAPDATEGLLTLAGYEDRLEPADMGPGLSRELVFFSDRPGDDFGLRLGGQIVGRLEVTGSHLEEGHQ